MKVVKRKELAEARGGFLKRHGLTPAAVQDMAKAKNTKVGVYIKLDLDVLNFFKTRAEHAGATPYQTQINAELRRVLEASQANAGDTVKTLREVQVLIETALSQAQRRGRQKMRS